MGQWNEVQAGTITSDNPEDHDVMTPIREERLYTMLAEETIIKDFLWVNYEIEEAHVNMDLGDLVFDELVQELSALLNN